MLNVTDPGAKQTFASSSSINLVPNIYAEWNHNTFYSPSTIASSISSEILASLNASLDLSLSASWTSANSSTIAQASGRTTEVRTTANCPQYHIVGYGDTLTSSSITVASTAKNQYYKMVFYMKSKTIQTFGTPSARISNGSLVASVNPSSPAGSSTWYYRIVPVGADGESYGLDYIGFTDQLTVTNASASQVIINISTAVTAAGYEIYRSSVLNDNNPTYLSTVGSTGNIITYTDNITSNKNNNLSPTSNFTNKIYVNPTIDCYNNTTLVNSFYIVKVFDDTNTNSYLPTGTAVIDPAGWTKVEVWFGTKPNSSNAFNKIKLNLNSYADYQGYDFYADNFQIYEVTEYDFLFHNYYNSESIFNPGRPGESLLNPLLDSTNSLRYVNYGLWNQANKPCSFYTQNPELITDTQYPYKQYVPSIYDNFQYYVSQPGLTSSGVQAYYDNYLKTNKIILKIDKFFSSFTSSTLTIVTDTGTTNILTNVVFGNDGIAIVYYNGTSWSQTAWSNPPQLNPNGQIQTYGGTNLFVKVKGIKFSVSGLAPNSNNINVDGQSTLSATTLGLIEISPRLEIDISPLLLNMSINKEIAQTGDESFPIGYLSSNSLNASLSNIPVYYNGLPFTIFENDSTESTFYNLMRQGVKFTTFYNSPLGSFNGKIPAGVFYSDSWQINDIDNVGINCFDQSKYLMMATAAPQYSATNAGLEEIITDILNISGFSDYNYDSLISVLDQKAKINYFWCDETTTTFEVLQSLFIAHQISAFFDEYGIMQFISLKSILNKFNSSSFSADFFVGDRAETVNSISYSPNIIPNSFSETIGPKVGKVIINYKMPTSLISDYVSDLNADIGLIAKKKESVKTVWQEDVGYGLACTPISKSMNNYQNYFYAEPGLITGTATSLGTNSGDIFIGSEIVSFEGVEYTFFPSNNYSLSINRIITGSSDIDSAIKELKDYIVSLGKTFDEIRYYPTGKIVGVMRGKYNTPIQNHNIYDSLASTSNAIYGTIDPANYFKSGTMSTGATSVTLGTLGQGTTFTYGDLKMSSASSNVSTLISPNELSKNYNYFAAEFRSTYRHADQTRAGLFFNVVGGSTTSAMFLAFSRYAKNTGTMIELFNGSPGGTAQTYIYDDSQTRSVKTYSQALSIDLFDGSNHRIAAYMSNPYLYIYVDGREVAKIQLATNLTALVPNSTSNFGAFVQNISASGVGVASVTCNEIYASNFPVYDALNNKADFKYLPRYHFNSETYLDNLVHGIPNIVDNYLWQAKPLIRGIKFYDVKHSLSPAIPSTATIEKVFYGVATAVNNETKLVLKRVDAWNASYSNLCLTPFRSRFAVTNNHNEVVWLKIPGDNIGNLTIFPLQIQSNYQYLTDSKVIQKVIDRRYANTSVQLTTDWIQGEGDAYRILMDSASLLTGFHREITIKVFGNPLIQLGDFCKFTYTLKRMGTQTPIYYFVKSITQSNSEGLETQLVLKPMIFA